MAKNTNGKRLNIALASLAVVIIGVASSGITKLASNRHQVDDTATDVVELKVDGCDPANDAQGDIKVFDVKLEGLKEDFQELRIEQRADVKEMKNDFQELRVEQRAGAKEIKEDFQEFRIKQDADKKEILAAIKESK